WDVDDARGGLFPENGCSQYAAEGRKNDSEEKHSYESKQYHHRAGRDALGQITERGGHVHLRNHTLQHLPPHRCRIQVEWNREQPIDECASNPGQQAYQATVRPSHWLGL